MYPINIVGDGPIAHAMVRLCRRSGFSDVGLSPAPVSLPQAATVPANQTRLLTALGLNEAMLDLGHCPDRWQIRLAPSGYLLSELPLGNFYHDRYGSPMVNMEGTVLADLLRTDYSAPSDNPTVTIDCATPPSSSAIQPVWKLWHAAIPGSPLRANCTWLSDDSVLWHYATKGQHHLFALFPAERHAQDYQWPEALREHGAQVQCVAELADQATMREFWQEPGQAFIGQANLSLLPCYHESWFCGLEDAWVLSRMLENYEEEFQQGLAAYEKYRRPRTDRVRRWDQSLLASYTKPTGAARISRNIGIALRSRFLPEIAMQRLDWFHSYDCIKGFN